jgi:hypothetical protein
VAALGPVAVIRSRGGRLEALRYTREDGAPRSELRGLDADPRAVAQFVFAVGDVDDVEPRRHLAHARCVKLMLHARIDLRIIWPPLRVREAFPQP